MLKKLNRTSIKDIDVHSAYHQDMANNAELKQKKWKMKQKSASFKDELPELLKTHQTIIIPSFTKTAIVSPFIRSDIEDEVKRKFHKLNQHTIISPPILYSKPKPITLKRNCAAVISDIAQSPSKTSKLLLKKQLAKNIGSKTLNDGLQHDQKLPILPKVSTVTDSKGKVVYIGASLVLKNLKELKQARQQRLKAYIDKKEIKFKDVDIMPHTKKSTKDSKHCSSISGSTHSKSKRSPKTSSEAIPTNDSLRHCSNIQKPRISSEPKPDCTKSRQNNKASPSPKSLQKPPKVSLESFSVSSPKNVINSHQRNSLLIPNIELIKSRLKKTVKSPSKSSSHNEQLPLNKLGNPDLKTFVDMDTQLRKRKLDLQATLNVLKIPEIKIFKHDVGNANYKTDCFNDVNRFAKSAEAAISLFSQDVDKEPENLNDIEMIDISVDIESLPLHCSMEVNDLSASQSYVFVVDTNIFIHKLSFLNELKDMPLQGCGLPYIYIPWIVIQELDGLKSGKSQVKYQAIKAIKYIFSIFNSKHPRIRGQKSKISKEVTKAFGDSNDDAILSFCSVLAEKTSSNKLGLLSNDINLCNKAMMIDINAFTTETLFTKIKPDLQSSHAKDCPVSSLNKEASITVFDNPPKPTTENLKVKSIICEAKLILKEILEPFLHESMQHAFEDMKKVFLNPLPETLLDVLAYYKKYWISVFGVMFNRNIKKYFDLVMELFNHKQGFSSNIADAMTALMAIENICRAVAAMKPSIYSGIERILRLMNECKALETVENDCIPADDKSQCEIAFSVFNYLWDLINHLCGMIMDFARVPHNLTYVKPANTPPISEFQKLLSNLLPSIHLIKQGMFKVIDITTASEQATHEQDYKRLYNHLLQFVPSLEIHASAPPTEKFTVQCLKAFMLDPDCREKVKIGYNQLQNYQEKLLEVVHLSIWKN